jgi:hypothetical protein
MTTYVMRDGALVDKRLASPRASSRSAYVISDIEPFTTQEGAAITSRVDLREYERRNGVKQIGTDWPGSERPPFWDRHLTNERTRGRRR